MRLKEGAQMSHNIITVCVTCMHAHSVLINIVYCRPQILLDCMRVEERLGENRQVLVIADGSQ